MSGKKIPCCIIGTGRIASFLEMDRKREKPATHAGAISAERRTFLAGGCDRNPDNLAKFGDQWKLSPGHLYEDVEKMLDWEKPEIVVIATDPDSHMDYLQQAVQKKISVIICEKPVSDSVEEAAAVSDILAGSSSRVVVNHERRFSADYIRVRKHILDNRYGQLLTLNARLYMGRTKPVYKVLWHDGTHMVDIIHFLTGGTMEELLVLGNPMETGNCFIHGRSGGVDCLLECSSGRDHLHFELDLSFERGRIRIGNGIYQEEESRPSPFYEQYRSLLPVRTKRIRRTGYFANMMAHAADLVENPGMESLSPLTQGLAAISVIQEAIRMAGGGDWDE